MEHSTLNPALFWAKLSPRDALERVHPLICHMIDVASVARAIWGTVLTGAERRGVASSLGCTEPVAAAWTAFIAGLHDIGKASPAFQSKDFRACERLKDTGLTCRKPVRDTPHGVVSAVSLMAILPTFGLSEGMAGRLATVVGGHHGVFPRSAEVGDAVDNRESSGGSSWAEARLTLAELLATLLDLPRRDPPVQLDNASAMFLAGLISVADWIGSVEELFPPAGRYPFMEPQVDVSEYFRQSASRAEEALRLLGWTGWSPPSEALGFSSLFPKIKAPYPVQREVTALVDDLDGPGLVVVEAPMGEGKTEAAIFLADRWGATLGQRGCYFALPTQATSDQMYGRVLEFLKSRYPVGLVNLQLLHGHASLSALFQGMLRGGKQQRVVAGLELAGIDGDKGCDGATASVVAGEWFTYRKRGLLAPFGVGTIDQALLGALQTRHVFVRLFGLAHKTVILDEIHAYDAYMTALLQRLLEWLGALGSSVVLLSATLPDERRLRLVEAYARGAGYSFDEATMRAHYPRISWVSRAGSGARQVGVSPRSTRKLKLEWVDGALPTDGEPFNLGERLRAALGDQRGCVAVICNTVARAQQVYLALKPYFPGTADDGQPVLDLLHARYLYEDRQKREKRTLVRFGKLDGDVEMEDGTVRKVRRPDRAVLISTQIIEQSLDLDFDLMVTDLAPVDLLLQRSGRLHRHERGRPAGLEHPTLWICRPREEDGVPIFGPGFAKVYDEHMLLRTWLELKDRKDVRVPEDVEDLIERVYGERVCPSDACPALQDDWGESWRHLQKEMQRDTQEAQDRWLKGPVYGGALWKLTGDPREEDAPDFHQAHQALTRLTEPSVSVILLDQPVFVPGPGLGLAEEVDINVEPSMAQATRLLARSVSVSDRRVVFDIIATAAPPGWRRSSLLRHHRVLNLDQDGGVMIGKHYLRVSEEIGLFVAR